ncbi:MAG: ATP-binding protein [Xanthobacteraceae bacterium]|nr:ATP-binding protein [Xanthobacteraceae bacterium]
MPVPPDAPIPPAEHFKLGKPSATWTYTAAAGAVLGHVLRFNTGGGEKEFRPLTLWRPAKGGKTEWRWESWPSKRPLYGLRGLAERPSAPVMVCEGEKAADATTRLLPGFVAVTSPNGSKSAAKADWSPLRGRAVTVWPDADLAGLEYARQVAKLSAGVGALSVVIVSPPEGVAGGWDAADAAVAGWDERQAAELIAAAKPIEQKFAEGVSRSDEPKGSDRRRTPQRDTLIGITDGCELWHDADRTAYATFGATAHHEHWPVRSREFRMWLSGQFFEATGGAIGGQALEDGVRILEARAVNQGPQYEPFIRVGRHGKNLYLDLCDARWRAVEITGDGWSVVEKPAAKLMRSSSMRPLPEPESGGMIEELRGFLNVRTDDDFMLVVAWLVAALRDRGPYPVLAINGEQGAGKSVFSRMIRALVDPSAAPIRAVPKDDRDLVVSAGNSWALVFDNLSSVPAWFADALCRLATGSGFATRMLHTDRSESIFDAARPIVLNGIPSLTDRADLADRAVTIHLATITEEARDPEDELIAAFEAKRPVILGALLDAVSCALRNLDTVKLVRSPRMADLAKWITAAEPALGWDAGQFLNVYRENRRDVIETSFEADAVAVGIRDYIISEKPEGWTGTATELLAALNVRVNEGVRKSKLWPLSAQGLGNRIDRVAPLLRNKGFVVERRHSGQRHIIINPPAAAVTGETK